MSVRSLFRRTLKRAFTTTADFLDTHFDVKKIAANESLDRVIGMPDEVVVFADLFGMVKGAGVTSAEIRLGLDTGRHVVLNLHHLAATAAIARRSGISFEEAERVIGLAIRDGARNAPAPAPAPASRSGVDPLDLSKDSPPLPPLEAPPLDPSPSILTAPNAKQAAAKIHAEAIDKEARERVASLPARAEEAFLLLESPSLDPHERVERRRVVLGLLREVQSRGLVEATHGGVEEATVKLHDRLQEAFNAADRLVQEDRRAFAAAHKPDKDEALIASILQSIPDEPELLPPLPMQGGAT